MKESGEESQGVARGLRSQGPGRQHPRCRVASTARAPAVPRQSPWCPRQQNVILLPTGELELFNDLMPHGLTDPAQRGLTEVIYCVREDIFYCVVSYFTPLPWNSCTSDGWHPPDKGRWKLYKCLYINTVYIFLTFLLSPLT